MSNFMTVCCFPALCSDCNDIVEVNLLARPPQCPKCKRHDVVAYDQLELRKRRGKHVVADWNMEEQLGRVLILTDGDYHCPACGKFQLTFEDSGLMWD
jgi:hypothetical protein